MTMNIIELETGWKVVQEGIDKMISHIFEDPHEENFRMEDYMMLYSTIRSMCSQWPPHNYSQQLYERYGKVLEEYLTSMVLPALREKHDEFMLLELVKRWNNNHIMVRFLSSLFRHLDRFLISKFLLPSLTELGHFTFRTFIYLEVKNNVKDVALTLINREREGEEIDRALMKKVLDIFAAIGDGSRMYYEVDFEMSMLLDTASYYCRKAASWIQKYSFPDYMIKVEKCLKREKDRLRHYLYHTNETKLLDQVRHQLISAYKQRLLENKDSGLHVLLRDDKVDELSRMYSLFSQIPTGLEAASTVFEQHVCEEGTLLIKQAEDHASTEKDELVCIIGKAIGLLEKYQRHVTESFLNNSMFCKALSTALVMSCNQGLLSDGKSAEALAIFCDNLLRKGSSGKLSDESVEETIDKVVELLKYISDKDLFAEFHRKALARRILFDKCANHEHERSLLIKLKQRHEYGAQLTYKMETMVKDLALSRENQTLFEEYLNDNPRLSLGLDLTMTVLTTGFWPIGSCNSSDLVLPSEMVKCVESFNNFYQTRADERKLTWLFSLGSCHIVGNFDQKQIGLLVNPSQAALLLLFNETARLSYMDIKSRLNLSHEDAVRLLFSFSCDKYKILNKHPDTKNVSQSDMFEFNHRFTNKMRRIRIPLPSIQELKNKRVSDVIDFDRRFAMDACIVRIMKCRSVLPFEQLEAECVEQLCHMFKPDSTFIQLRTQDLMRREFLTRDKENPNVLIYLP